MFSNLAIPLFAIIPLATAHFHLSWPTVRGFDSSKAGNFPCGGFDSVSSSRTEWPINGGPVQLRMEHSQTRVKVLLAIGEDPGSNFNVTLRPTFAQEGLGNFCVGQLNLPSGMNVSDGTPATIQVVSNGDPEGGLYQVSSDILFLQVGDVDAVTRPMPSYIPPDP
jgi:nascent polypeptide-associated complex subunit beta